MARTDLAAGSGRELDEMKAEYYAACDWDDGAASTAKLRKREIIG